MAQAAFAFINKNIVAPQSIVLLGSALTLVVLIPWRLFVRPALWTAIGSQRVVFVGFSSAVEHLAEAFREQPALGMEVLGYVLEPETSTHATPYIGNYQELFRIVVQLKPDRVIVGADGLRDKERSQNALRYEVRWGNRSKCIGCLRGYLRQNL